MDEKAKEREAAGVKEMERDEERAEVEDESMCEAEASEVSDRLLSRAL